MNWTDAENLCQASVETGEGHLASVLDQTTNDFMTALTTNRSWLGGHDSDVEGDWRWSDGSPWGYESWASSEPNDAGAGQDYLSINFAHTGLWADDGGNTWGGICQYNQKGNIKQLLFFYVHNEYC